MLEPRAIRMGTLAIRFRLVHKVSIVESLLSTRALQSILFHLRHRCHHAFLAHSD